MASLADMFLSGHVRNCGGDDGTIHLFCIMWSILVCATRLDQDARCERCTLGVHV